MTGVFEALDEIDVDGIRTIVGNATQIFNNLDSLLTTQTSNIGKEKGVFCYSVLNETENKFFVISDISSVLNESREAIQNVIGGVQNTIDNVREMRS